MQRRNRLAWVLGILLAMPGISWAQGFNGAITGVVKDSSGGVVPDAALTLRNVKTDQTVATTVSGPEGEFAFRNLAPGHVRGGSPQGRLPAGHAPRHRGHAQLAPSASRSRCPSGRPGTEVEVIGGSSVLSVTRDAGARHLARDAEPAAAADEQRPARGGDLCLLMPGVSTGGGNNAFDARINGGLQSGDEASVDGVSMQQGFMSQGGMVSIFQDFPMSPDMVSEVKVLTSNYAPEYGSSTVGPDHGGHQVRRQLVPRLRLRVPPRRLAARPSSGARTSKPPFNKNNYGANIGGPVKVPGLWDDKVEELLLLRLRGLPADGRLQPADAVDPLAAGAQRRLQRLARRSRQPDPDLRPGDAAVRRQRRLHQGSVHGLRRQHAQRDLSRTASTRSCSRGWRRCRRRPAAAR